MGFAPLRLSDSTAQMYGPGGANGNTKIDEPEIMRAFVILGDPVFSKGIPNSSMW